MHGYFFKKKVKKEEIVQNKQSDTMDQEKFG